MLRYTPGILPIQEAPQLKNATERELRKIGVSLGDIIDAINRHPGIATAWVVFNGIDGSILDSYNIKEVTRASVGTYKLTFTKPMVSTSYAYSSGLEQATGNVDGDFNVMAGNGEKTLNDMTIRTRRSTNTAGTNPTEYDFPTVSITIHGGK